MDYEKKYRDLVEAVKELQGANPSDEGIQNWVNENFPELKESEDERIRKRIIATIHLYYGEPLEDEAKEMIAWIEKQGEQKPDYCHHEVDLSGCSEEYRKAYYDGWNNCNQQHAQLKAEQKPDWSEEDQKIWEEISDILWEGYKQSCSKFSWDGIRNWLKPKIDFFKDRVLPQPKQEWSEEDERVLSLLLNNYKQAVEHRPSSLTHAEVLDIYNWLKSLRPQNTWKPSDEQMDILCKVSTYCVFASSVRDVLRSLYNDLKKL